MSFSAPFPGLFALSDLPEEAWNQTLSPANLLNHVKITYFISLNNQKGSIFPLFLDFIFFPVCLFVSGSAGLGVF